MVSALSTLLVFASLVVNASGNLIAGRQTTITDKKCGSSMCLSATVNGSNVDYVLSSLGKRTLGWMGMGFGRAMAGSPMVIMWADAGRVILSQRTAPREVMPTVDPNPPRVAILADSLTSIAGDSSSFGFTIPANGDTKPYVIFSYGIDPPGSSAVDATLLMHYEFQSAQFDLSGSSTPTSSGAGTTPTGNTSDNVPLLSYQRMIVAHGIFCAVGFLLFLPAGALLARYFRTFTSTWFTGHWVAQFAVAGPTIIVGIALGFQSVKTGKLQFDSDHKKLGIVILVLYVSQIVLGAVIHWVKPRNKTRRPIQNYVHGVVGVLIIALAMYQVYNGFTLEWPKATGRGSAPGGVSISFYVWISLIAVSYFAGLALLPKQFRQENQPKRVPISDDNDGEHYGLGYRDRDQE